MLNKHYLCLGRAKYYNKYGVIADVMQNHLSEILYLLAMDLPSNLTSTDEINQNKHRIIEAITNVLSRNVVIGQYAGVKQSFFCWTL